MEGERVRNYKFRIYPNERQRCLIIKTFGCVRYVYNYFLSENNRKYEEEGKYLSFPKANRLLTDLKHSVGKEWLREPDKNALQYALMNLDDAFQRFFRGVGSNNRFGHPKFKSKRNPVCSYRTACSYGNIKIFDNKVQLPKLGLVKCSVSRAVKGRIFGAIVKKERTGKFFVIVQTELEQREFLPKTNAIVGIDVGIKNYLTTSEGEKFENPKYFQKSTKRLVRLHRRLSRKPKDSKRREKTRIVVARAYEKVTNQRRDFLQKLSSRLVKEYDLIAVEDLDILGMLKNKKLSKRVADASWYEFISLLEYKSKIYGKIFVKVGKFFPSSLTCSHCGNKSKKTKDLDVRFWTCPFCGAFLDRDLNAAVNILKEGVKLCTQ